jgi:hypothetical protein
MAFEPSVKKFRVLSAHGQMSMIELIEIGVLRPKLGTLMDQYRVIQYLKIFKQRSDYSAISWRLGNKLRQSRRPLDCQMMTDRTSGFTARFTD